MTENQERRQYCEACDMQGPRILGEFGYALLETHRALHRLARQLAKPMERSIERSINWAATKQRKDKP